MLLGNGSNTPKLSTVNKQQTGYQDTTESQLGKSYRFQLSSKSSSTKGKKAIAASTSSQNSSRLTTWNATGNTSLTSGDLSLRSARSGPATNSSRKWNGSFLNRTSSNVNDYNSYDFSRPVATLDLGSKNSGGKTAAQLRFDFGTNSPTRNVQSDNFAVQAWTTVKLKEGKFYKASSSADEGARFFFKDRQTGKVLASGGGSQSWNQVISVPKGGKYDFYVQAYDSSGRSNLSVKLEESGQTTGRVLTSSGLNLRRTPSSTGNTPIRRLNSNETFSIVKQVKSRDASNPNWYEIKTRDGKRGYVSADSGLTEVVGGAVTLGGNPIIVNPPIVTPQNNNNGNNGGSSSSPGKGYVKGNSIGFRTGAGSSASLVGDLGKNTKLNIVEKVTGERYSANGVGYDQWYKVKANVGGREQIGYVAAYYVDAGDNGGKYPSALNPSSTLYSSHLSAAAPYKTAVTRAAASYSWLKPSILAAIGSRESGWGIFLDANDTGDGGHGRGIMQIDDRYHQTFINSQDWRNPGVNIKYAVDNVLSEYYNQLSRKTNLQGFDLLRGAIAAYNAGVGGVMDALNDGLDVDGYTTGGDYSWDVIQRAGWFQDNGWA
jgi:hypothetical protein